MLIVQVISLTEELQAKASSPTSEPEEHTTASGMVHAGASAPAAQAAQPKEGCDAGAGAAGRVAAPAMGIAGGSPESYSCFADARSPPSCSDDDCGGAASSEGGCAFFLPDGAMIEAAVERESEAEAATQLNYWAWFWN